MDRGRIIRHDGLSPFVHLEKTIKPGFHTPGKSQTVWDFTFSRSSLILPTNENSKSQITQQIGTGTNLDNRERFFFSRRVPDFCDSRRSFPTNENSNLYRRRPSLITNPLNCWAPVPLSQIKMASLSTSDFPPNSLSEKSGTDLWRISDISSKSGMVGKK